MNHVLKAESSFPINAFPLPETLEEAERLVASIERAVQQETNGGVQDLAVEMDGEGHRVDGAMQQLLLQATRPACRHGHPRRRPAGQSHRSVLTVCRTRPRRKRPVCHWLAAGQSVSPPAGFPKPVFLTSSGQTRGLLFSHGSHPCLQPHESPLRLDPLPPGDRRPRRRPRRRLPTVRLQRGRRPRTGRLGAEPVRGRAHRGGRPPGGGGRFLEGPSPRPSAASPPRCDRSPPDRLSICRIAGRPEPRAGPERRAFKILHSDEAAAPQPTLPADLAACGLCLAEIHDPLQRRYRYPFTNCTNCGPRWSIIRQLPYDRPRTSMAAFAMCPQCLAEYGDPADRRFHAQPIACPQCGPALELLDAGGRRLAERVEALEMSAAARSRRASAGLEGVGRISIGRRRHERRRPSCCCAMRKHRPTRPSP